MHIFYHEQTKTFHLCNEEISYITTVLPNGQMGQLYFGKRIHDREDFSHFLELSSRPMSSWTFDEDKFFSLEHIRQEYGLYGTGDFRLLVTESWERLTGVQRLTIPAGVLAEAPDPDGLIREKLTELGAFSPEVPVPV